MILSGLVSIDHIKELETLHLAGWSFGQVVQNMDMIRCLELTKPGHTMGPQILV